MNTIFWTLNEFERIWTYSSIGDRTLTPYFWLQTIDHQTSNVVRPITKKQIKMWNRETISCENYLSIDFFLYLWFWFTISLKHLPSSLSKFIIYCNSPACAIRFMFGPIFSLALNTAICYWATCWALFSICWVANLTVHAFRKNWDKLLMPQMGKNTLMFCFWQLSQFSVRADLMK